MKKKISLFANSWNSENLDNFIMGLRDVFGDDAFGFFGNIVREIDLAADVMCPSDRHVAVERDLCRQCAVAAIPADVDEIFPCFKHESGGGFIICRMRREIERHRNVLALVRFKPASFGICTQLFRGLVESSPRA